ncbi:MAG: tetratricopeptide repeat protein [Gammaproteobacteria bacterium]|nr:tetratricopeptide repeat protein [Gammaproteobacteria bacterium]
MLQIAEVTAEPLGFPAWTLRALIIGSIVGFPVVFFLAWVIRIEPEGLLFDLPLWRGDSERVKQKTDYVVVLSVTALLLIGAYTIGVKVFRDMPVDTQTLASQSFTLVEAPPNSIAVMAFENFGGAEDANHFGSGLAEEILIMLAGLRELSVAARSSSFQFRGQQIDIRDVARNLSVRYVLEGSVRQSGDRIRVSAQLIDGADGYNAFSKTYDRKLEDIFAIQEEIAAGVVNELKIALSVDSEEHLQEKPTEDIGAYVFYLQGVERLRSPGDMDVFNAASQLFRSALDIDPNFSRAYAGLCEAHLSLYEFNYATSDFDKAEAACDKAAELDPGLSSEIQIALGTLYRHRGWYEKAEEKLSQAIAMSPTAVNAYIELGEIRMIQDRRDEAEATFLRAVDLKKNYWRALEATGHFYYNTENYADAVKYFEMASNLSPDSAAGYSSLGAAYWMLGESEQARVAYDRSLELKPTRRGYTNMGLRYYYAGQFSNAVDMQEKALEIAPDDHRLWGRLAESHRFVPGNETLSAEAYARAAELAEANLEINELDWATIGLLGLYYAHLGDSTRALDLVDKSVAISQRNAEALYYQALARLKTGDQDGAIDALVDAVATDEQYRQFIVSDPDFQPIKDTERFAKLLTP